MTRRASASSAVSGIFNDRRISVLEVRRNGLQDFSIFSVVGICNHQNHGQLFELGNYTRVKENINGEPLEPRKTN